MLTIILAGGTGTMGRLLQQHFLQAGYRVVVLGRSLGHRTAGNLVELHWDARTIGPWAAELEGAAAVINLAGRSVDCRYTTRNKAEILNSRVDSTIVLGRAVEACAVPPNVWINLSSATIYRHAQDKATDVDNGDLGNDFSPGVVKAWEEAFFTHARRGVRQVAVRCAMVFCANGGALPRYAAITRAGLGGRHGSGNQYVSWVHGADVGRFFQWAVENPAVEGVIDLAAPAPVTDAELMRLLRENLRPWIALPSPVWMLTIGAAILGTETELILKSRRVVPSKAQRLGFRFQYPELRAALPALLAQDQRP